MKYYLTNLFSFIFGGFIIFCVMMISLTLEYGRLSNHTYCNMSMDNLETLDESSRMYYQNGIDDHHEEH